MADADFESSEQQTRSSYLKSLREFRWLLAAALAAVALAVAVNLLTLPARWWFVWVVFAVGAVLAFKVVRLFTLRAFLGLEWDEHGQREYLDPQ